jgi:hypothetical protein
LTPEQEAQLKRARVGANKAISQLPLPADYAPATHPLLRNMQGDQSVLKHWCRIKPCELVVHETLSPSSKGGLSLPLRACLLQFLLVFD